MAFAREDVAPPYKVASHGCELAVCFMLACVYDFQEELNFRELNFVTSQSTLALAQHCRNLEMYVCVYCYQRGWDELPASHMEEVTMMGMKIRKMQIFNLPILATSPGIVLLNLRGLAAGKAFSDAGSQLLCISSCDFRGPTTVTLGQALVALGDSLLWP